MEGHKQSVADPTQEATPIMVTMDDGALIVTTSGDGSAEACSSHQDHAQIMVVETEDGCQEIQLVTNATGEVFTLPPEVANRLKENLSNMCADGSSDVQQIIVTEGGEEQIIFTEGDDEEIVTTEENDQLVVTEDNGHILVTSGDERQIFVSGEGDDCRIIVTGDDGQIVLTEGTEGNVEVIGLDDAQMVQAVAEDKRPVVATDPLGDECSPEVQDTPPEHTFVESEVQNIEGSANGRTLDAMLAQNSDSVSHPETGTGKLESEDFMNAEWVEASITSSTGAQLTVRLPSLPASAPGQTAATQQAAKFRAVSVTGGERVLDAALESDGEQTVEEDDAESLCWSEAWARPTHRLASRGIARAVAALKRSDSEDDDDDEEAECSAAAAPAARRRGRGRPPKVGVFSCQLCRRQLPTQAKFFAHLHKHYEAPQGDGAPPADGSVVGDAEMIDEEGDAYDGPAELNVDIIASRRYLHDCEHCHLRFHTVEELDLHGKVHLREMVARASEEARAAKKVNRAAARQVAEAARNENAACSDEEPRGGGGSGDSTYEMKNLRPCTSCPKIFTTTAALTNHQLRTHSDGKIGAMSPKRLYKLEYECMQCHVTYTSQKIYERHLVMHENQREGRRPHACTSCDNSFITSQQLKHHQLRDHPADHPRPASATARPIGRPAGSSDKDRQAVYDLISEHGGTYNCTICGKTGANKHLLFYHVSTKHNVLKGHTCNTCQKSFFTEAALRVHERVHTGERPFACSLCPRRFRQSTDLSLHVMAVHAGERPFRCQFCDKGFARKYSLTIHMRCHTNERNYKCRVCNKGFRASTYLTGHMKIHTGEREHQCPICQKAFRMRSDMKRHIFTHAHESSGRRSLRKLTMSDGDGAQRQSDNSNVMLLSNSQLCNLQFVTDDDGEAMVITDGGTTIDQSQAAQFMVSAGDEYDESAMASMYLLADADADADPDPDRDPLTLV